MEPGETIEAGMLLQPSTHSPLAAMTDQVPGDWGWLGISTAVLREVYEEAGLLLDYDKVAYKLSQPWPFPASLMIGCVATMHEAEIQRQKVSVDYHELDEARWFDVKEVAAMLARSTQVPPRTLLLGLARSAHDRDPRRKGRRRVSCTCHRHSRSRII